MNTTVLTWQTHQIPKHLMGQLLERCLFPNNNFKSCPKVLIKFKSMSEHTHYLLHYILDLINT